MAETWRITPGKRLALATLDAVARPFSRLLLPQPKKNNDGIWKILVVELWNIGDVVIATTALQALRARYPDAWIAFLGKPHAEEILRASDLVDEVITFDFPWTSETENSRSRYDRRAIKELFRRLREERFDLSVDCRMDLRSNLVTFATHARRRVGYAFGGGSFLLTDAIPAKPRAHHRVRDWLTLMEALGSRTGSTVLTRSDDGNPLGPRLTLLPAERVAAATRLASLGIAPRDLIVGVHVGAGDPNNRWQPERFGEVADSLADSYGARIVVFVDPDGSDARVSLRNNAVYIRSNLRELMGLIGSCDLLLCNEGGPMHIADGLGVPVVAVFTTGNPKWYGPSGRHQKVVGKGAPHGKRTDVQVKEVLTAAQSQIERAITARAKAYGSVESSAP